MSSQHSHARILATLVKREFIEQRLLFVYAPLAAIVAALLWFGIWMIPDAADQHAVYAAFVDRTRDDPTLPRDLAMVERFRHNFESTLINARYYMAQQAMLLLFWATMAYYALYTLYRQRVNRSVLFWSSLPVSDTQTVASKLLAGPILCYLWYLLCSAALDLAMYLLAALHDAISGKALFAGYLQNPTLFAEVTDQVIRMPLTLMWILPVFGWLLLASAWAQRAPFAWAAGPWLLLIIGELALNDRSWLLDRTVERLLPIEGILEIALGAVGFTPSQLAASAVLGLAFLLAAIRFNRPDDA